MQELINYLIYYIFMSSVEFESLNVNDYTHRIAAWGNYLLYRGNTMITFLCYFGGKLYFFPFDKLY